MHIFVYISCSWKTSQKALLFSSSCALLIDMVFIFINSVRGPRTKPFPHVDYV